MNIFVEAPGVRFIYVARSAAEADSVASDCTPRWPRHETPAHITTHAGYRQHIQEHGLLGPYIVIIDDDPDFSSDYVLMLTELAMHAKRTPNMKRRIVILSESEMSDWQRNIMGKFCRTISIMSAPDYPSVDHDRYVAHFDEQYAGFVDSARKKIIFENFFLKSGLNNKQVMLFWGQLEYLREASAPYEPEEANCRLVTITASTSLSKISLEMDHVAALSDDKRAVI